MSRVFTCLLALSAAALLTLPACASDTPDAQAPASTTIALTGARIIDGTGGTPLEQGTLVISDGRVQAVGAADAVQIPEGATRVDVSGKTIMPGIINAHAHVSFDKEAAASPRDQLIRQLKLYADYGVTTAYALGSDAVEAVKLRDEQERDPVNGARLYTAGGSVTAKTPEEGRQRVDALADQRVNIIKTRVDGVAGERDRQPPEVYRAIIDQAHKRGLRVAAHMFYLDDAKGLVDAGLDILAHAIRDKDVDPAFIEELKRRNVGYIATLTRDLSVFVYETTPAFFKDPFFLKHLDAYREEMEEVSDPALMEKTRNDKAPRGAQDIKKALAQAERNLKILSDGGVAIAFGTDTGASLGRWQGYFEHTEMEMMVKAGMTPMQVLVSATGGAARVMQIDKLVGTLVPGKAADLIVLGDNPLTDIRNTRMIESVWIAGRRQVPANTN